MRRIAFALLLVAAVVGIHACAADAPTAPKPGTGGGQSSAISVQLFTSNANPKAGTCTLLEAIVTLNGASVPDGTSVNLSTDFGSFGENGLPLVSVVTTNGAAVAALCGPGAGTAKVKGTVTIAGKSNSATLSISFQPDSSTLPFVSYCSPSFGDKVGGTALTLNGGRFFGSASTTRVTFNVNGVSKDGVVTSVTSTAVTVTTPGFPEVSAPTAPAAITLIMGTNLPVPVVLSLPTCFVYGATDGGTPTVTAVLPASGAKAGNTRVTIVGSGFSTGGVQVFFGLLGGVEATVVSVSYNQVIALSPPAPFNTSGLGNVVPVIVKNISSGAESNADVFFTYTPDMHITAIANASQSTDAPFTPVTIYGTGFQAPVVVTLAGIQAFVQSVSATELVVLPGTPQGCGAGGAGGVVVVNITTGETAVSPGTVVFTYVSVPMTISTLVPSFGQSGNSVEIDGQNLPTSPANAQVLFGAHAAMVNSASALALTVNAPPGNVTIAPTCTGTNLPGTPQDV
ncbi:MAG: IPT/TIG domain-containing protein, partial [Acidobacteriota bacterium]